VTVRGRDLALRTLPLTVHRHRQILSIRTQSDLICAPWLVIARQPATVQIRRFRRGVASMLVNSFWFPCLVSDEGQSW
jgi:hypothetical protein